MKIIRKFKNQIDASFAVLLLAIGLFTWTYINSNQVHAIDDYVTVEWVVSEGESLWTIASKNQLGDQMVMEEIITWIKNKNGLSSERIYPGQTIYVPILLESFASEHD
ncbi:LysM peptidoglycan-binding domain-containing protein [Evansella sp. AB-rgal1]|uniref:cell division suppressor protein YneA n=1 Tax=Evansella sp. AB-rgal1 TaxID=3242696 RepID=UPI00359ECCAD